jgi:ABC-type dipeptide/oligopeptide/nickel transport system permease subunit
MTMASYALDTASLQAAAPARTEWQLGLRQLRKNPLASAGMVTICFLVLIALIGPLLPVPSPLKQDILNRAALPSAAHLLGTDQLGRDMLARLIFAARSSLLTAAGSVILAMTLGIPLGLCAGYFGGAVEAVIMRLADAILSFPAIVLAIALVASLGPGARNVLLAIGLVNAPVFARLVRATTQVAVGEEYIAAARAIGARDLRIMLRHVLPASTASMTVQVGASFAVALITEATLSFLGLGVQAPNPSWGLMLNDARQYLNDTPWMAIPPAATISLAVLAVNFVGDGLRDAFDPRYRSE